MPIANEDVVAKLPLQDHPMGCCSAAIAGLLGLPLSEVPDFWTDRQFGDVRDWLSGRGLCLQEMIQERLWDGRYLVAGKSPRGNSHFVIYEDGKLSHDPHPEGGGLVEVTHTWLIYPRDPAPIERMREALAAADKRIADLKEWALEKCRQHHQLAADDEYLRMEHIATSSAYRELALEIEARVTLSGAQNNG